jgi:(p)ppGpp synthase/HD superfamily hydrolase
VARTMGDGPFVPTFVRGLPLAQAALEYAAGLHHGQRRASDDAPFLLHPLEVAALLATAGYPERVISAALLHDTVEDAEADPAELRARFGAEVAELVGALTEDAQIEPFPERKAALRRQVAEFGSDATAVYAADKVAKVRELRARAAHDPAALTGERGRERLEHYRESLAMLEERDAHHPLIRLLRFEIEALYALPPVPPRLA